MFYSKWWDFSQNCAGPVEKELCFSSLNLCNFRCHIKLDFKHASLRSKKYSKSMILKTWKGKLWWEIILKQVKYVSLILIYNYCKN
jgi:hypothetical protein